MTIDTVNTAMYLGRCEAVWCSFAPALLKGCSHLSLLRLNPWKFSEHISIEQFLIVQRDLRVRMYSLSDSIHRHQDRNECELQMKGRETSVGWDTKVREQDVMPL